MINHKNIMFGSVFSFVSCRKHGVTSVARYLSAVQALSSISFCAVATWLDQQLSSVDLIKILTPSYRKWGLFYSTFFFKKSWIIGWQLVKLLRDLLQQCVHKISHFWDEIPIKLFNLTFKNEIYTESCLIGISCISGILFLYDDNSGF